jgi:hypothetical protein
MSEIKHKHFASIATKYSLAYNYILISLHVLANVGHPQANTIHRRLDSNVSIKYLDSRIMFIVWRFISLMFFSVLYLYTSIYPKVYRYIVFA